MHPATPLTAHPPNRPSPLLWMQRYELEVSALPSLWRDVALWCREVATPQQALPFCPGGQLNVVSSMPSVQASDLAPDTPHLPGGTVWWACRRVHAYARLCVHVSAVCSSLVVAHVMQPLTGAPMCMRALLLLIRCGLIQTQRDRSHTMRTPHPLPTPGDLHLPHHHLPPCPHPTAASC